MVTTFLAPGLLASTLLASTLLASTTSVAAAADGVATTVGTVIGRLLFVVVGGLLLFFGLRRRSAAQRDPARRSNGNGLIIAGSVLLGLSVLALITLGTAGR